jgi:hypothetical protein
VKNEKLTKFISTKQDVKRLIESPWHRWDLRDVGCEGLDWIKLA